MDVLEKDVREAKKRLRAAMKAQRMLSRDVRETGCDEILKGMDIWKGASAVLLYASLPGEVPTDGLIASAVGEGKNVVLPLVDGNMLRLKRLDLDKLVPGYMGIMEPSADSDDVDPYEIELAIVPGVAFDRQLRRLGRGKGFYDRTLPLLGCSKVGLAFDWQIVDEVPSDPWDVPLDAVVTPSGCIR